MHRRLVYSLVHFLTCALTVAQTQGGSSLPMIAVFLGAIIGMTALAVDISRIAVTASEVQQSADIAATAGARAFFARPRGVPLTEAQASLRANTVDGKAMSNSNLITFQMGNYNEGTGAFTSNLPPTNAVKAVVQITVPTMLMKGLSASKANSTVTKTAIAAFRASGSGYPTLPIVLGDCHFHGDCFEDSCMPRLTQVPDTTNNSAWTTFFDNSASTDSLGNYLPNTPCVGGGGQNPFIKVGDVINLNNGQANAFLKDVEDMVEDCHLNKFLIPIVPCNGQYNQSKQVLGFATIIIDQVKSTGSHKGIDLHGIYEDSPGTVGGANYGTGTIGLVQ